MAFTDTEIYELRRILASFKDDLPPHELGYWYITRASTPLALVNEEPPGVSRSMIGQPTSRNVQIRGHGQCMRCGKRFDIPGWGNFTTWDEDEWITKTIAKAKAWVENDAARDGPCWGDVPTPPDAEWHGATLDGVAAMREP